MLRSICRDRWLERIRVPGGVMCGPGWPGNSPRLGWEISLWTHDAPSRIRIYFRIAATGRPAGKSESSGGN